ncbi:MAG: hypothetical protein JRD03_10440 [Deltaproteobacteria bacterium]|nr:hypothetical protein [Deltaproteobacteria bacterium]
MISQVRESGPEWTSTDDDEIALNEIANVGFAADTVACFAADTVACFAADDLIAVPAEDASERLR